MKLGLSKYKECSNLHLWDLTSYSFPLIQNLCSLPFSLPCWCLYAIPCLILALFLIEAIQVWEQIN